MPTRNSLSESRYVLQSLRPHQWIKNLFVFAAPMFGKRLFEPESFIATAVAFVGMCLASSAIYVFNDLADLDEDRLHPLKRNRPLAAGTLRVATARLVFVGLAVAAIVLAAIFLPPLAAGVIAAYIAMNIVYSLLLKHVVILDVMFIAVGFILRILAGAFATSVQPSYWLILCTFNVSLFLGFVKRRAEIIKLGDDATHHRKVLQHYSPAFLDQMVAIVTGATLVCYILYTVDGRTAEVFQTHMLVATVPFVTYGLFRYLYLSYHLQEGGSPSRLVVVDKAFLVNVVLWAIACFLIIHFWVPLRESLPRWKP